MKQLISGIPSSPPFGSDVGSGPSGSADGLPITANFVNKNQKMNLRTIVIIALSAFVLMMVLIGAFFIVLKWKRIRRPSSAVGPAFTSSINKQSGKICNFFLGDLTYYAEIGFEMNVVLIARHIIFSITQLGCTKNIRYFQLFGSSFRSLFPLIPSISPKISMLS